MINARKVQRRSLICHPGMHCAAVREIAVSAELINHSDIKLVYALDGDIARLCIPEPRSARHADRLWEHSCFEAFVGRSDIPAYAEFNFSPSGEWAAYAFRRYRERQPVDYQPPVSPRIEFRRSAQRIELSATVSLEHWQTDQVTELRLGLSAVVEEQDGARSYWALAHPGDKPDFHDARTFTLDLRFSDRQA